MSFAAGNILHDRVHVLPIQILGQGIRQGCSPPLLTLLSHFIVFVGARLLRAFRKLSRLDSFSFKEPRNFNLTLDTL